MHKTIVRWVAVVAAILVVAGLATTGVAIAGNSWRFTQEARTITTTTGTELAAVLTTPQQGPAKGLVVMVHGDGPVEATQYGLYDPWFEGAAEAGWATLSWSKPGVGRSTGDWLSQSMADRAAEVGEAIDWAREQADIPTDRIVLWGASQAGWVLPDVVAARDDIAGVVAVGTAINWLRQGRYNLEATLDHDGATAEQRRAAERESERVGAVLAAGGSYQEYLRTTTELDPMPPARWDFISRNFRADATEGLRAAAGRDIPWHLMAGQHDRNVDVAETERTYREILGDRADATWFDAAHSMARPIMEDSDVAGSVTGLVWPRALLAPGVIEDYAAFLDRIAASPPR